MFGGRLSSFFGVSQKPAMASSSKTAKDVPASHKFTSMLRGRISDILSYFFKTDGRQGDVEETSPAPKDPSTPLASVDDSPKEHTLKLDRHPVLRKPVSSVAPKPDFVAIDIPEDVLQVLPPTELFPTRATKEMLSRRFAATMDWIHGMNRKYHQVAEAVHLNQAVWERKMRLREVERYNRAHGVPPFEIQPIRFKRSSGDEMRQRLLKRNYHAEVSKAYLELHRQMPLYNQTVHQMFYRRPF